MVKKESTEIQHKVELGLEMLLGLILLFLPYLIPDKAYPLLNDLGEFVGYIWLWKILLFLLIVIAIQRYLYRRKSLEKTSENNVKKLDTIKENVQSVRAFDKTLPQKKYHAFHAYNGVNFRYHILNGEVDYTPYCTQDKIPMQKALSYLDRNAITYECHVCKERVHMNENIYKKNYDAFCSIVKSHIAGYIDKMPTESKNKPPFL